MGGRLRALLALTCGERGLRPESYLGAPQCYKLLIIPAVAFKKRGETQKGKQSDECRAHGNTSGPCS